MLISLLLLQTRVSILQMRSIEQQNLKPYLCLAALELRLDPKLQELATFFALLSSQIGLVLLKRDPSLLVLTVTSFVSL